MTKVLLIKSCSDRLRWYRDKVGQTVPYLGTLDSEYKSREDAGYINFVQLEDAEILEIKKKRGELNAKHGRVPNKTGIHPSIICPDRGKTGGH